MRHLLVFVVVLAACTPAKPPPPAPAESGCSNGDVLQPKELRCQTACVQRADGMACVALASAEQKEPCGTIACGAGCTCSSEAPNVCLCSAALK